MSSQRTHYVTTTDGVTIGATVRGDGPPLVFLQGSIGDGDLDWQAVAGNLSGRFTCHLPNCGAVVSAAIAPISASVGWSTTLSPTSTALQNRPDWWVGPPAPT